MSINAMRLLTWFSIEEDNFLQSIGLQKIQYSEVAMLSETLFRLTLQHSS